MFFARINTMARRRSLQRREVTHAKGLTGAAPRAPRGSRGAVVPLAALALALAALLAGVARVDAAKTLSFDEDQPADPRSCACSDVDPHANFTNGQVEFSCYQQATFGQCNEPFMRITPQELSEGYCQISCGRCDCCESVATLLANRGFKHFLALLNLTSDEVAQALPRPGFMAAVVAAHDDAVLAGLAKLGYSSVAAAAADAPNRWRLQQVAQLHMLPPVPVTQAVWTSPFMLSGQRLPTALLTLAANGTKQPVYLTAQRSSDGARVRLDGPKNSGWLWDADTLACKSVVHAIDTLLLPAF